MKDHKLHNVLYARLDAIANAEKITRKELGAFSVEALTYVVESHDIDIINRLINILTPMNRKVAILYFGHFLPWEQEKDGDEVFQRFGKMMNKQKKVNRRLDLIKEWLSDEKNNIWTWADTNLDLYKVKNWAANITKAVEKALQGEETDAGESPAIDVAHVIAAVMAGGVDIGDMLEACASEEQEEPEEEVVKKAA